MKKIITSIFLLSFSILAYCCDPVFYGFHESICNYNQESVFVGKIINQSSNNIQLEIIQKVRSCEELSIVTIWDGTTVECNGPFPANVSDLGEVGDSVICLAQKIDSIENNWDVFGDYRRPIQFNYEGYLRIYDGQVYGLVDSTWGQINYLDYIASLTNSNECLEIDCDIYSANTSIAKEDINVYPSPTSGTLFVDLLDSQTQSILIYNSTGKLIDTQQTSDIHHRIDVSHYSKGMYYMSIQSGQAQTIKKFIVD